MLAAMLVAAVLGLAPSPAAAQSACTWQKQLLPAPAGTTQHQVDATDHSGGFAGRAYFSATGWRVVYWKNGRVIDYGSSGRGTDRVVAQNRAGTIAGMALKGLQGAQAVSFRIRSGQWELLPGFPGAETNSRAVGIAGNDDVYGHATVWQDGGWETFPIRWPHDRPGVVEQVTGLPDDMGVVGVDHDGTLLVGAGSTYPWPHLWRDGVLTRLPAPPDTQHGYAQVIADGLVGGSLRLGTAPNRPAYWDRNGQPHVLPQGAQVAQLNGDGLVVSSVSGAPFQVWRYGTLLGQLDGAATVTAVGDDDSIGGTTRNPGSSLPAAAVWRCAGTVMG
uniref:Uncharacterized protein n=1 Tax=Nonomuraea gerenzanensis TaxID=93944 RepID=A0A1M4E1E3_9ACTN|nr:hypothetical protein BN4615_P2135 [Nonomuraea gerenzanensis]